MKIKTRFDYPPIPVRNMDWSAIDDDTYCGEGCPIGHGATEQEAIADLLEQLEVDEDASLDPESQCSAMMLRDLHRIKEVVGDPRMRAALMADLAEYDHLLSRIQLELSALEVPKFRMVWGKGH